MWEGVRHISSHTLWDIGQAEVMSEADAVLLHCFLRVEV